MPGHAGFVKTVVVAQYYPGGNKQGRFFDNIQPPITDIDRPSKLLKLIQKHQRKKSRNMRGMIFEQ